MLALLTHEGWTSWHGAVPMLTCRCWPCWHMKVEHLDMDLCQCWHRWDSLMKGQHGWGQPRLDTAIAGGKATWKNDGITHTILPWRRHQMETFSTLLAICAGNSPVPGEFPAQRPVTRSFDVFFDLPLNKRLSKQWWGRWFEMQSRPLWRHCNADNLSMLSWHGNGFFVWRESTSDIFPLLVDYKGQ